MHVVVIGGGVIGLTTAYHLSRAGAEVTVVDAGGTGTGASRVNAGWVVPSCAEPVPGPGMVLKSLRWMLRRDSPLYIRPSLDPAFVRFMLDMRRRCNAVDQRAGFEAHLELMARSAEVFDDYRADGIDFELRSAGLLMAFTDRHNLDHHLPNLDIAERHGLEPQVLLGDAVREQEPLLSARVRGGIYFPHERHLAPDVFVRSLAARLVAHGVRILENAPVGRVSARAGAVTAVHTTRHDLAGDAFVLATGAWSGRSAALFGARLPVRPGKGYSIDLAPLPLRQPVNLSDAKVAVTPLSDRLRLAGTMEFGGLDQTVNNVRVQAILRAPAAYFRGWRPPSDPPRALAGCRPMTPDGLPVIGRLGGLGNAYVSTGHAMLGLTLAPATAQALSALILHGDQQPALAPFSADRFTTGRPHPRNTRAVRHAATHGRKSH